MLSASPPNLNCTNDRPSSTSTRAFINAPSPMPPYSCGVCTPKNPDSFALSRRVLSSTSRRPGSPRRSRLSTSGSSGMISLRTKVRTHSRTSRSSSDRFRSMTSRLLVVGELRTQLAFEYLVARAHGKGTSTRVASRILVPAQPLARPLDESLNVEALPHVRDDHGAHLLTALLIRCLLYTSPSPRDRQKSRMPSSA